MASQWGKKNGLPGYDSFRTGLSYRMVWEMMRDESEDPKDWKYKRRGTILGMWHELKLQMYHQAVDQGYGDHGDQGDHEVARAAPLVAPRGRSVRSMLATAGHHRG